MSILDRLEHAEAISSRVSAEACKGKRPVLSCGATLHVGFFFDGFGRNLESDMQEDRLSNVSRLFMAHPDNHLTSSAKDFNHYRRFYISGLGSAFDQSLGSDANLANTNWAGTVSRAEGNLEDLPQDKVTEAGVELGKDFVTGKNWFERFLHNLKPAQFIKGALTSVATSSLEALSAIRDNPTVAQLLKTGVDTRLEAATQALNKTLDKIHEQAEIPLKRIAVSVYGFDYGASLARALSHKLLADCEPGSMKYQGVELELVFAGLFDAVDRSMDSSVIFDYLVPIQNKIEDGECLPGPTKAALHLIAAHEHRDHLRSRLIGASVLTPRWQERLVPGVTEDVGGGLRRSDVISSSELHLVCLHEMYLAAYRAGVPFYSFSDLYKNDADTAELFALNDHINGVTAIDASKAYLAKAGTQPATSAGFLAHRRWYIRHLRELWQMYYQQYRAFEEDEARWQQPILGSRGKLAQQLGISHEPPAKAAQRERLLAQAQARKASLRSSLGWLEDVEREAQRLRRSYNTAEVELLLDEWFNPKPVAVSAEVADLFEYFLNDRLASEPRTAANAPPRYFALRRYDAPDWRKTAGTLPNTLEQLLNP